MVVYNYSGKEINAKIVYYGPALSGKTTNLEWIYSKIPVEYSGKMVSLRTQADRTIFFDFLPLDLGMIDGFRTRFMLYTVPGQVHYNATRKMVLKGVDGLVFVADSEPGRMQDNVESLQNLRDNLQELGMNPDSMPLVMQWNKRDLPNCMTVAELETELNPRGLPSFEACALTGEGVYETLHKVCRSIYTKLTGSQVGVGEEDPPLFGESIAQCLQDVDVPQPEPERVAIGAEGEQRLRSQNQDPLGAILGRSPSHETSGSGAELSSGPPSGSRNDAATTKIRPVEPGKPPGRDLEAERLGGLVDDVLSSLDERDDVPTVDHSSRRHVTATPDTEETVAEDRGSPLSARLDHFFDGQEPADPIRVVRSEEEGASRGPGEVPSQSGVDMGQERPSPGLTVQDILGTDLGSTSPSAASAEGPETDPGPAGGGDPAGFAVEHDEDVFAQLSRREQEPAAEAAVEEEPGPDGDFDLDAVLQEEDQSPSQDLELITDPRRLPSERPVAERSGSSSTPFSLSTSASTPAFDAGSGGVPSGGSEARLPDGMGARRVIEVPLTLDAELLEGDGPVRIVLNLSVRR